MTQFLNLSCPSRFYITVEKHQEYHEPKLKKGPYFSYMAEDSSEDPFPSDFMMINKEDISNIELYQRSMHIFLKSAPMSFIKSEIPSYACAEWRKELEDKGLWEKDQDHPDMKKYAKAWLDGVEGL